jgi:hypothetical protein
MTLRFISVEMLTASNVRNNLGFCVPGHAERFWSRGFPILTKHQENGDSDMDASTFIAKTVRKNTMEEAVEYLVCGSENSNRVRNP